MNETLAKTTPAPSADAIERVLITGDLGSLTPEQRVTYYGRVCTSLGLNPLTKPFDYIVLNNKLTLYAKRDATDQLRKLHGISITLTDGTLVSGVYVVKAHAQAPDGRVDEATGAVSLGNLTGEALANALMKTETKAKRRVTLSICGLGLLDETEVETVPGARAAGEPIPATPQRRSASPPSDAELRQRAKGVVDAVLEPKAPPPVPAAVVNVADAPPLLPTTPEEIFPDEEDPRPAGVLVEKAKMLKSGQTAQGPWTLYAVKFADGADTTTFDSALFDLACDAIAASRLVRYETKPGKKEGTLSLVSIEYAS